MNKMRNKFSEWVEQGIAKFDYIPILPESSETDIICKTYNNVFAMALDTHMSMLEDGRRIITGHNVATKNWEYFINCCRWGGMDFTDSGLYTVNCYLRDQGLEGRREMINGDIVWLVDECRIPEPESMVKSTNATNESINEAMGTFLIVNKTKRTSYVVIAKDEQEAVGLVPDDDKRSLKSLQLKGLTMRGASRPIILTDSDMVSNK